MRRFKFRFEAVKKQRSALLEVAQGAMGEVQRRHTLATDLLAQRREHLATLGAQSPTGAFNPQKETIRQHHLQATRLEITRRATQVERLEEELNAARQKVAEAHRALKAMEIIEERDLEAWKAEAKRLEQVEVDERNAQRFERDQN